MVGQRFLRHLPAVRQVGVGDDRLTGVHDRDRATGRGGRRIRQHEQITACRGRGIAARVRCEQGGHQPLDTAPRHAVVDRHDRDASAPCPAEEVGRCSLPGLDHEDAPGIARDANGGIALRGIAGVQADAEQQVPRSARFSRVPVEQFDPAHRHGVVAADRNLDHVVTQCADQVGKRQYRAHRRARPRAFDLAMSIPTLSEHR
ncbi:MULTISPECIES: hypothetical protein [unclassified Saccharopolyspora]|uniref:hypothetical protein n=1 Tax=Saccharopolyspora TaxID=1835 RepID=UPI001F31C56C|nr:hypothetical protein [Saccharopolyspora sp. HNM0986]